MNDDLGEALDDLVVPLPGLYDVPAGTLRRAARRRAATLAVSSSAVVVVGIGAAAVLPPGSDTDRVVRAPIAASPGPTFPAATAYPSPRATPSASPGVATLPSAGPPVIPAPAASPPSTTPAIRPRLVLQGAGLDALSGPSSFRHLDFATTDAATMTEAATRALGTGTPAALPDCGAAVRTVRWQGFAIFLDGTRFVGWAAASGVPRLTTADGLGTQSTLAELRSARSAVTVTTGTLGPEWSTGDGLAGQLSGTASSSRVTRLAAGNSCIAR